MELNLLNGLFYLIILSIRAYGANLDHVKELYDDLFTNYKKQVLPVSDTTKPLSLGTKFYLVSLNEFKEVEETLSLLGVFALNWTDPSMIWDGDKYGHLYVTTIDPSDLWIPSIFLMNRVDSMKPIGHDVSFIATIVANGEVYYNPGGILEAKCPTDISKFPFDTQECMLEILPWGLGETQLTFNNYVKEADLSWYTKNSDWELLEYSTSTGTRSYIHLYFIKLRMKRASLYYAVMIILPTILFAVLNPVVFVLPVESGERVSFAMTILLSYAIFLTLVSASIPASSNPMCMLLIVMIAIISVSGAITFGAIITARYYFADDTNEFWYPLERYARWRLRRKTNIVIPIDEKKQKEIIVTGKDIANGLDIIFLCVSYFAIVIIAVAYFVSVFT